jgi:hypothetical protein
LIDQQWVGKDLFASKGVLVVQLKTWWYIRLSLQVPIRNRLLLSHHTFSVVFSYGFQGECGPSTFSVSSVQTAKFFNIKGTL